METAPLKSFATQARTELIREVTARITAVLAQGSPDRVEQPKAVAALEEAIAEAGGSATGRAHVADKVAYTWFNRIIALRFMDANSYTGIGVVSPAADQLGQPEVLAAAKRGQVDSDVVKEKNATAIIGLLNGTRQPRPGADAQAEAYALLLADYCRFWHAAMPFMFEREGDYTELLIPSNLLADDSVLSRSVAALTGEVCQDAEVIGWLYQFYISERKDEVFAGFKKNKKAGADEIPAATQLFTPHWIVRYLVENSLGRLWMLNRPSSHLANQMDYYIAPVDGQTDFLKISKPEELKVIDPACGSGHMLTYAFDLLYAIYEEEGYTPSQIPSLILANNLYGTEIDPRSGALAAFALTMKAVAKRKLFLKSPVQPNVCVLDPVSFSANELSYLVTSDGDRYAEAEFWNQFSEADLLGSLIQPDFDSTVEAGRHLDSLDDDGDMLRADTLERARKVIRQANYLSSRYSIVVANPPYMGNRNMTPRLGNFIKSRFPAGKQDLYGCFILRAASLAHDSGLIALVVGDTWMSIKAFDGLRSTILSDHGISSFVHCVDISNHPDIFGANTAFVLDMAARPEMNAPYFRLEPLGDEAKRAKFLEAITSVDVPWRHEAAVSTFLRISGTPITYWLPSQVLDVIVNSPGIGESILFPSSPHKTGDNEAFVRRWWEVSVAEVDATERWVPYAKGGGARRWYGLIHDVVDWSEPAVHYYSSNATSNLMRRDPKAGEGITYSMLTSGTNTFRILPPGAAYDMGGPGFFPTSLSNSQALSVVNSGLAKMVLDALNPTLNLQVRDVKQIPVPNIGRNGWARLEELGSEAVEIAKKDWDEHETSIDFAASPLVNTGVPSLQIAVLRKLQEDEDTSGRLTRVEDEIDDVIWAAAGVDQSQRGKHLKRAILFANSKAVHGPDRSPEEYRVLGTREAIESLISYAVGCMFGRYSLEVPGLILANQGGTLQDYLAEVPNPTFAADEDNVIPVLDGDWFEDDVVGLFRKFLRTTFGDQHFEANLTLVTEAVDVRNLRDYFITKAGKSKFYDDHVQRYRKRPIYWLFSSPKGSFNALVYMHRYTSSTVSTVLSYLREYVTKLESSLQQAERAGNAKEADRLRKILVELNEYEHDTLYPKASEKLVINLDDGVKANYPKFGAAVKKIIGLEAPGD